MEDIYLDHVIDNNIITETLTRIFPELRIFHYDFSEDTPEGLNEKTGHIFFNCRFDVEKIEFGFHISIYRTPDEDEQERQLYIGRLFADMHQVRVLAPFTHPEMPDNPYYDIIFENSQVFLANDSDTNFADGTEGRVKILKTYLLPEIKFDGKAQMIR